MKDVWFAVRFAIVGVGVATFYVLAYPLLRHIGLPTVPANVIAYLTATALQYVCQTAWTFRKPLGVPAQMGRFVAMIVIGLAVSAAITSWIAPAARLPDWQAAMVVVVSIPVLNFLLMRFWVYRAV